MIINKYGIRLTRLKENDLELVRQKRNSKAIRERMIYQKEITREDQKKWFKTIDNINNIYLLIHVDDKPVGLINGKDADFEKKISEGGIFIWEESYLNSIVPSLCAIIMHDYNFHICEFEKTYINVLKNNDSALKFNKLIGYIIEDENPGKPFYTCSIHRNYYYERIEKYRKALGKMYNDYEPLNKDDFSFDGTSDEDLIRYFGGLPQYLKDKVNTVLEQEGRNLL